MYKVKSTKTVIDENRIYTANVNDDDTRSFKQYNLEPSSGITSKNLVTDKPVDNVSSLMDRITVNVDGDQFTGVSSREKEIYAFETNKVFDLQSVFFTDKVVRVFGDVILVSPSNGDSFGDITLLLKWFTNGDEVRFNVQISDDNFNSTVFDVAVNGFQVVGRVPRFVTTYQWRVRPIKYGKFGSWSEIRSFTITIPVVDEIVLLLPENNKDDSPLDEELSWEPTHRATHYDVEITAELTGTTNNEGFIIDQNGNITNESGDILIEYGYYFDDIGRIIDKDGNIVDSSGNIYVENGYTIHPLGYIVDKNGNIVSNTGNVLVPSGYTINENGDIITTNNEIITKESLIDDEIPAPVMADLLPGETVVNTIVISSITTQNTSYTTSLPYYDTNYTWRARAKNDYTSTPFKSRVFMTESADLGDFSLIYPTQNQVITDTIIINLEWSKSEFSVEYRVKVSQNGFLTNIIDTITDNLTIETQGLLNNNTYEWSVQPINRTKMGAVKTGSFSFDVPSVEIPLNFEVTPNDGVDFVGLNATLVWTPTPNADFYEIKVSKDNFTTLDVNISTPNTTFNINNLQPDTTYKWSVRAVNSVSVSDEIISSFTTESSNIGEFDLLSPVSGETIVDTLSPTLTWSSAPNATSYDIEISDDNFNTIISNATVNNISYSTTNLTNNQSYQWRVKPKNRTKFGVIKTSYFMVELPDVVAPTILSPNDGVSNQLLNLPLIWEPVFGAKYYDVEVSENGFSSFIRNITTQNTSYTVTGLDVSTNYQWRVRARNDVSTSDYSTRSFTTESAYLNVNKSSVSFSYGSGSTSFSVSSNIAWSVTDNASWISVSSVGGFGDDGYVLISRTSNSSYSSRSGTVTISGGGITRTISVTQSGAPRPTPTPTPRPTATPTPTPTPVVLGRPGISVSVTQTNFGGTKAYYAVITKPAGATRVYFNSSVFSSSFTGSSRPFSFTLNVGSSTTIRAYAIFPTGTGPTSSRTVSN